MGERENVARYLLSCTCNVFQNLVTFKILHDWSLSLHPLWYALCHKTFLKFNDTSSETVSQVDGGHSFASFYDSWYWMLFLFRSSIPSLLNLNFFFRSTLRLELVLYFPLFQLKVLLLVMRNLIHVFVIWGYFVRSLRYFFFISFGVYLVRTKFLIILIAYVGDSMSILQLRFDKVMEVALILNNTFLLE